MLALITEAKAAEANAPRDDHMQLAIELVSWRFPNGTHLRIGHDAAPAKTVRRIQRVR